MALILSAILLVIVGVFVIGAFIAYQVVIWTLAIGLVVLAILTALICYLLGIDDPKSVFFLLVIPATLIGLVVWGNVAEKHREKAEAERKAKEQAERLAR